MTQTRNITSHSRAVAPSNYQPEKGHLPNYAQLSLVLAPRVRIFIPKFRFENGRSCAVNFLILKQRKQQQHNQQIFWWQNATSHLRDSPHSKLNHFAQKLAVNLLLSHCKMFVLQFPLEQRQKNSFSLRTDVWFLVVIRPCEREGRTKERRDRKKREFM